MTYNVDLTAALDACLADKDIRASIDAPDSTLDDRFVRARIERSLDEIRRELSREIETVNVAEAQAASARSHIARSDRPSRVDEALAVIFSLAFLAASVLGVTSIFTREPWNALIAWLSASFQFGLQAVVSWGIVGVLGVLLSISAFWNFFTKPRLLARLRDQFDVKGIDVTAGAARKEADARLTDLVRQHVRQLINEGGDQFFQDRIWVQPPPPNVKGARITRGQGLSEVTSAVNEVPTETRREVLELLEALPGGSIGISGPRGAGKSTLLLSLCGSRQRLNGRDGVSIYTASPVDYDAREFLLHLFATLCRQVLKINGTAEERAMHPPRSRLGERLGALQGDIGAFMFVVGGLMAVFGLVIGVAIAAFAESAQHAAAAAPAGSPASASSTSLLGALDLKPGGLVLWGVTACFTGAVLIFSELIRRGAGGRSIFEIVRGPRDWRTEARSERPIIKRCRDELSDIRFQRTFTSGFSGGLKVPVGLEFGGTAGESIAERQESLPELVERFRDFVVQVASEYGKVLIGIDELDKLKSTEAAETFLNEIKSIFNISGCFYLISVSENAVTNFERRGLPFRDVFDSAFDDIHYIDYLDYDAAKLLLSRRVLNLPEPYLSMCFVFSGGLPRDLIRTTRALLAVAEDLGPGKADPPSSVKAYAQREARAKLRASAAAARIVASPNTPKFLVAVTALETIPFASTSFDQALNALVAAVPAAASEANDKRLSDLRNELVAYFRYLRLCVEVFSAFAAEPAWRSAQRDGLLKDLARARSGFEASVAVAEARIEAVRARWDASVAAATPAG